MTYLIKFDENGRRSDTYVAEEKTQEQVTELLEKGFVLITEEDYQLLIGNIDGHEYIHNSDGSYSKYESPEPTLEELKAIKLSEVDVWTESKITGGFISECTGEIVRYDSDKDTQLTMQGIALNVSTERFKNEYPDGCPVRGYKDGETVKTIQYLNASQVYTWCADLSSHVGACKQQGWSKQAEVAAALSKEDLDAIILN
ncbi:DUF4376 domain-containing protein [Phascolarctobacterium faecium]|uniref:DUF4376 domain-containing protein n=1 Tax=Phascolarctobacterium faecium TaxID=33025 RepID=UPI00351FD92F